MRLISSHILNKSCWKTVDSFGNNKRYKRFLVQNLAKLFPLPGALDLRTEYHKMIMFNLRDLLDTFGKKILHMSVEDCYDSLSYEIVRGIIHSVPLKLLVMLKFPLLIPWLV